QGSAAQTADLMEVQNSSGTVLAKFDANGILGGANGSGSNVAGSALTIAGGQGTGTANGGNINFQIARLARPAAASMASLPYSVCQEPTALPTSKTPPTQPPPSRSRTPQQ